MNRLFLSLVGLFAFVNLSFAQDDDQVDLEVFDEVTVMMQSFEPLPDVDVLVLLGAPHPKYPVEDFTGGGNWYYSGDGAYTWSELEHHTQIQPPHDFPTPLPGKIEGGIAELGFEENQEVSDSVLYLARRKHSLRFG